MPRVPTAPAVPMITFSLGLIAASVAVLVVEVGIGVDALVGVGCWDDNGGVLFSEGARKGRAVDA